VIANLQSFVSEHFKTEAGNPIVLAPYQEAFIRDVLQRQFPKYIFLASTRIGKTESSAVLAALVAILYDGEEVCIVAPTFKQAERMFKRIKSYFQSNKRLMSLVDTSRTFRRDEISLKNGSVLRCLSASNPESLLGFGATTLIVDEAGSIDDSTFKTRILRMTASSAARDRMPILVLLGTPHRVNHFYDAWLSDDFRKFRATWRDGVKAGILSEDEVEYYRKVMTETEFRMWFEAEFTSGESGLFDKRKAKELMIGAKAKGPEDGWDYYAGLDVARFGSDESAFVVIRVRSGVPIEDATAEMVYYSCRAKRPLTDVIGWAKKLIEKWKPRYVAVDELGLGSGVYDHLKEALGDVIRPVRLAGQERVDVYMSLLDMIENSRIVLLNDDKLEYQLGSFSVEYQSDGRLKIVKNPRVRDDVVDALAMACYILKVEKSGEIHIFEPILRGEWL